MKTREELQKDLEHLQELEQQLEWIRKERRKTRIVGLSLIMLFLGLLVWACCGYEDSKPTNSAPPISNGSFTTTMITNNGHVFLIVQAVSAFGGSPVGVCEVTEASKTK